MFNRSIEYCITSNEDLDKLKKEKYMLGEPLSIPTKIHLKKNGIDYVDSSNAYGLASCITVCPVVFWYDEKGKPSSKVIVKRVGNNELDFYNYREDRWTTNIFNASIISGEVEDGTALFLLGVSK